MEKVKDWDGNLINKFRFSGGGLFEYDYDSNAYFLVYKDYCDNTFKKALEAYFQKEME